MIKLCYLSTLILIISDILLAQPYGIDERIANTSLQINYSGEIREINIQRVFENVSFTNPLFLTHSGDKTNRIFVVQNSGQILVFPNNPDIQQSKIFLDIRTRVTSGGEKGLLGLAFHPSYSLNGKFYVSYTTGNLKSRISEFSVSENPDSADAESERILLEVNQPQGNHNGGMIAFGKDGYLYISFGDGGGGGDPYHNGQDPKTLLGAILRIDVNGTQDTLQYKIPEDNPFTDAADGSRHEIFAYGLRNPWRFSFDRATGMLWCGDVGQGQWEEVDIIRKGQNYGWNVMEGFHCYGSSSCDTSGLSLPIVEYSHSEGYSITGGYVYRGDEQNHLYGTYIYGDYGTRLIWGLRYDNNQLLDNKIIGQSPSPISSFGEDESGEVYVVGYDGKIYKITVQSDPQTATEIPDSLSKSGLYKDILTRELSPGLIPYDVNSPLWSDGAQKERILALPDTTKISFEMDTPWTFPDNSIIIKNFLLELETGNPQSRKMVETRFLIKRSDNSGWDGFSYMWNNEQTEAVLLPGSNKRSFIIQGPDSSYTYDYYFPSRNECLKCHTPAAGYVLGVKTAQLNKDYTYPNDVTDNQLRTLNHIRLFNKDIGDNQEIFPKLANPSDISESLQDRVRSYLDANCAQCHQPGGTGVSTMDLRYTSSLSETKLINENPEQGDLGINGAKLILPGYPDSSVVFLRMSRTDDKRMPPLAVSVPDSTGLKLLRDWIISLQPTNLEKPANLPQKFSIKAYPNPFNPTAKIEYTLPQPAFVKVSVHDITGKVVFNKNFNMQQAGIHTMPWNGSDLSGKTLSSGLYFYSVTAVTQTQHFSQTGKFILIK
ncbi:MAG: PQQ-dependent sugar dehydrogenase [Calditrichaeota bacterium]|nr:PQQ-dependent sugar dehydrogenase [Calditrichota bacterium]